MFDEYITEFFKNLGISLQNNMGQPGAEKLTALFDAFNALVSLRDKLNDEKKNPLLGPDEVDGLKKGLEAFSRAAGNVIHDAANQNTFFSDMVADFMPILKLQQKVADIYVSNIHEQRKNNPDPKFKVNTLLKREMWTNQLESVFKDCADIVKGSSLIVRETGQCDENARKAMDQMELYLKVAPLHLQENMERAKEAFEPNVAAAEKAIAFKLQNSKPEATQGLFDQLGILIPFGLQPSKISQLYHRKIGFSEAFRQSQRAAANAVVEEYLNTGRVSDAHGYVGLPLRGADPKKYVQDALKTIAVCDYINREKAAVATYKNCTSYPQKIQAGISADLKGFFSSEKPNDAENGCFDRVIEDLVKYSPAASFIYEDPATLKQRLGESTPEEKFAQFSGGQPNILKDADSEVLAIMSELSSSRRSGNSDSYNAVGDAMLRLGDAAHRPGGIVTEDYAALYKALRKYVYTHDSQPFTKSGQARFDAAAKLMVDVGLHLAELDSNMRTTIDQDIRVNTMRSKTFRKYFQKKVSEIAHGPVTDGSSFVPRARQIARLADIHLAKYNKKMDPTGKKPPVEMFTGKMPDVKKQQELLEKVDFTRAPSVKSIPKHIFTDISKMQNRETSRGQMSQRLPISVKLEDNRVLQGYFTENSETNYKEQYNAVLKDLCDSANQAQKDFYIALSEIPLKKAGPILQAIAEKDAMRSGASDLLKDEFTPFFNEWMQEMGRAGYKRVTDASKALPLKPIEDALKKNFYNTEDLGDPALQKTFNMLLRYVKNVEDIYRAAKMNVGVAKVKQGENLNLRNNALYDVAKLLNHPDLICKTVQMSVTDNGVQKQGTFMVNAKGIQGDLVRKGVIIGERTAPLRILPACKRDMSRIEVLDYLCGNIDRHGGNFFMDARFVPDANGGHVDICGLQGIDNDMSFGALSGKENVSRMSSLNHIRIMDKDQAEAVQNMKPEDFEGVMRGIGLSKEEIEAGLNRLSALQHRISTSQIVLVNGLTEWDQVKIKDYAREEKSIWSVTDLILEEGNKSLEQGFKSKKRALTPEALRAMTEPKKMETFEVRNSEAQIQIKEQVFYMEKLRKRFVETEAAAGSPAYKSMREGLDIFINYASNLSDTERVVGDMDLNYLADGFVELKRRAKLYIEKGTESAKTPEAKAAMKNRMNLAKNLFVLAEKGRHSIQEEFIDAFNRDIAGRKELYKSNPEALKAVSSEKAPVGNTLSKKTLSEKDPSGKAPQKVETEHPLINGPY